MVRLNERDAKLIYTTLRKAVWYVRAGGMPHEAIQLEEDLNKALRRLSVKVVLKERTT